MGLSSVLHLQKAAMSPFSCSSFCIFAHGPYVGQPIRPFVLSTRRPPSPNALRAPGLLDVVHRDRGGLGLPAGE